MSQKRLSMRKIEEILRLKYEAGLSHRAIAQSCSVSPSTVSEYVTHAKAAGLSWPLPEGLSAKELDGLLFPRRKSTSGHNIPRPDWAEVHKELRRKSVTLSLLWVEYRQEHPDGYGYSQFCHHYRQWAKHLKPMMRQKHKAGEKLFIDYAGQTVPVVDPETGEIWPAEIFVAVLGASNYTYAEAQQSQSLPNWIGGHVRALAFLGGTPEVLVPDNLKAGVKSPHLYEPDLNPTYLDFARHYGLAVVPARARKPKDKAKVEVGVQVVERWILARLRDHTFFSLAELNRAIRELLAKLNSRPMRHLGQSRRELFEELDQPALAPLPDQPYEFARWKKVRVHIDYHVAFEKHYYSVPYNLIGKEVDIRATEKTVEIFYRRTRQASHRRSQAKGRYSTQNDHMPPAHQKYSDWSPERFLRWAEEIGPHTGQLIAAVLDARRHPQQAYRSCLGILGLAKRYTDTRLEAACHRALLAGIRSYKGVRNILDNKLDQLELEQPPAAPLPTHANVRGESYYN
ncbi:MAG TPA: IS21 family transposase [Anaerolineae bacterium]|nr:IS21 family transposase [Anaerolineae bacterium]